MSEEDALPEKRVRDDDDNQVTRTLGPRRRLLFPVSGSRSLVYSVTARRHDDAQSPTLAMYEQLQLGSMAIPPRVVVRCHGSGGVDMASMCLLTPLWPHVAAAAAAAPVVVMPLFWDVSLPIALRDARHSGLLWTALRDHCNERHESFVRLRHAGADGTVLRCHRTLLHVHSPFLMELTENQFGMQHHQQESSSSPETLVSAAGCTWPAFYTSVSLMYLYESGCALEREGELVARELLRCEDASETMTKKKSENHNDDDTTIESSFALDVLACLHYLQSNSLFHLCHRVLCRHVERGHVSIEHCQRMLVTLSHRYHYAAFPTLMMALWRRALLLSFDVPPAVATITAARCLPLQRVSLQHVTREMLKALCDEALAMRSLRQPLDRHYCRNLAHLVVQWYLERHQFHMERAHTRVACDATVALAHDQDWEVVLEHVRPLLGNEDHVVRTQLHRMLPVVLARYADTEHSTLYGDRARACAFVLLNGGLT